eukprot:TRINITY_DN11339_c0_g1::TRINITY_DN11339_c0_g1_i1::g.26418::m.26418 TRINITY_DN11339_c0_g1::TRINITY_DN11339_c0_g1_i1::g.26418  ORF type:complete len:649 (+),score=246.62,sp/Q96PP9/GBP4_HUMAN/36.03/4e-75,GBP/PF02263.14/1.1e-65,GBP_C/PF02841.9/1.5e-33,GBP_C/PF02841.9/1.4e+04,MMR_HSR1/PF01926.18/0.21,TPR_MLP1_2/PF07926.7/8.2e+02,TPR_MLP1_2/PF07926.7/0.32,TPR_MLP1_2/PF07926.7/5,Dynamin_N/PF00350.18/0.43,Dynamin_N/PF00350.18/6.8e+02,Dynamin_N/PF00350.18/1.5e+04,Baculo_PEP_C/PF04513.7/6.8,Baculo_PEP_C/PF
MSEGRAIPFIILDSKEEQFIVAPEATAFLETVKGPVSVLAVVGPYRTGKSFVLNQVIGRKGAFQTGSTVNACTKGIWIWSEPITYTAEDGIERQLLLLDTEGLGAFDQSKTHDTRIFSLAVLLASYLVFNTMGTIDENAIEQLSFVANLTKHIHLTAKDAARAQSATQAGGDEDDELDERAFDQYADIFPRFLWLVRDFCLELVDESGRSITPKEYLEHALTERPGVSMKVMQRNNIRRCLKLFFRMRDCEVIIRPVNNEEELRHVDMLPEDKLRPEFMAQMNNVRSMLFKRTFAKTLYGNSISGSAFLGLSQAYVDAINSGAVPTLSTAWDSVREKECQKAAASAYEVYKKELEGARDSLPLSMDELKKLHRGAKEQALKVYRAGAIGGEAGQYGTELHDKMNHVRLAIIAENEERSREKCTVLLRDGFSRLDEKVESHQYSDVASLLADWTRVQDEYNSRNDLGPCQLIVLGEYTLTKVQDAVSRLSTYFASQFEKERQALKEKIHDMERQAMEAKMEFQRQANEAEVKLTKLETQTSFLERESVALKERMETTLKEKAVLEDRESQLRKDLDRARNDMDDMRVKKDKREAELNEEVARLKQELSRVKQDDETIQQQLKAKESELKTAHTELQQAKSKKQGGCLVM